MNGCLDHMSTHTDSVNIVISHKDGLKKKDRSDRELSLSHQENADITYLFS